MAIHFPRKFASYGKKSVRSLEERVLPQLRTVFLVRRIEEEPQNQVQSSAKSGFPTFTS